MRFKIFPLFLLVVIFLSCQDEQNKNADLNQKETVTNKAISKKEIQALEYSDYGLSRESQEIVANWQSYAQLSSQIDFLKKADFSLFEGDISVITAFLNDLKAEIPESIATNQIMARITVVQTKTLKLHSLLVLDNINREDKIKAIEELLVAYSNLNLQINKKLELDANNLTRPS